MRSFAVQTRILSAANVLAAGAVLSLMACSYDVQIKSENDQNYAVRMSSVRAEEIPAKKVMKRLTQKIQALNTKYSHCIWLIQYPDSSSKISDCNSILLHDNALKRVLLTLEQRPTQLLLADHSYKQVGSQTMLTYRLVITDTKGHRKVKKQWVICELKKMINEQLGEHKLKEAAGEKVKDLVCEKYSERISAI